MKKTIKSFFKNNPSKKIKSKDLSKRLDVTDPHRYAQLKHFLHQLSKENFIQKIGKRYQLVLPDKGFVIGSLQISRDGDFGFVIPESNQIKDIFIPQKYLNTAFHGDKVKVKLLAQKKGKSLEGEIIEIIKRYSDELTGTLSKSKSFFFVLPDAPKIHRDIYIAKNKLNNAEVGDKVLVSNLSWESSKLNPEGEITEVFGKSGSYDAEIMAMAREFKLPYKFPEKVLEELENNSEEISEKEISKRLDLRKNITFTIDPATAKDFDDAVSVEELDNGNFLVGVHIADVSHYIDNDSALFQEALLRATSVYLVGKVIPMLPEKLSNNICSLVPNKDRLTFSVILQMTKNAEVVDYSIKKTVINSKQRFTYEQVQEILENHSGTLYTQLFSLNDLAQKLRKLRIKKGSINFHRPEVDFELDPEGKPISLSIKESGESHELIEEFMLLANQIIASHVNKKNGSETIPFVYRIHDKPEKEKITELSMFVKGLGYNFDAHSIQKPKHLQQLLEEVKGQDEELLVNEIAIRTMSKAEYSTQNIGHFGLSFKYYTHFTSPIRRFPDLIVHKLLFNYINSQKESFSESDLEYITNHSSQKERVAINAERFSIKLKQIEYLSDKIGQEFQGVISGLMDFGFFVQLTDNLAEGLVKLRSLEDDYYDYDEKNYVIKGKRNGKKYRLGDRVFVKLSNIFIDKKEIDFILLDN